MKFMKDVNLPYLSAHTNYSILHVVVRVTLSDSPELAVIFHT